MIENEKSFKDYWKQEGRNESRCRVCGGIPVLVQGYDEMDKWWYIKCDCGIRIDMDAYPYGTDALDVWARLNGDFVTPLHKPKNVGKVDRCCTCLMKMRCVEYRGMNDYERSSFRCGEYMSESIKRG